MASLGTHTIAHARTDAQDVLVEADGRLADLNTACGGEIGRTLAIPELLALVVKTREYGLRLSRQFEAVSGNEQVTAWAEIAPLDDKSGCEVSVTSWQVEPLRSESEAKARQRQVEINRHLAECTARLDAAQALLSVESDAPDLVDFTKTAAEGIGKPWTDLVELPGGRTGVPAQWQLLDGIDVRIPGSRRMWKAFLEPLGHPDPGSAGFVLHLSATSPVSTTGQDHAADTPSLGRDLTPVLRQPVNRIIANAETIRTKLAGPLKQEYSDYAADIASAGQHLLALIDDLSDLEVVEAEDFVTAPDRIDLADVARRACGILGVKAQERRITLDPPAEDESQMAIAEFRRVLQVLLNLIGNAIRYSPEDSRVWVRLDAIGNRAMVTVADQGHGLDEQQQVKVFNKFERLGRGEDGGSGLGLYISRRIARAMDGDLTVESAPGQGARFTLSVPAARDEEWRGNEKGAPKRP